MPCGWKLEDCWEATLNEPTSTGFVIIGGGGGEGEAEGGGEGEADGGGGGGEGEAEGGGEGEADGGGDGRGASHLAQPAQSARAQALY
jgi:hypothetical protein